MAAHDPGTIEVQRRTLAILATSRMNANLCGLCCANVMGPLDEREPHHPLCLVGIVLHPMRWHVAGRAGRTTKCVSFEKAVEATALRSFAHERGGMDLEAVLLSFESKPVCELLHDRVEVRWDELRRAAEVVREAEAQRVRGECVVALRQLAGRALTVALLNEAQDLRIRYGDTAFQEAMKIIEEGAAREAQAPGGAT